MQVVKAFFRWLWRQLWPWAKPTLAKDVIDQYVNVHYRGIDITFRRHEKLLWDRMSRKERTETWAAYKKALKKGEIVRQNIDGKIVTVKKRN